MLLATVASPARALDPNRAPSQYLRDHWGPDRGFPSGPVYAISQTSDGYLWIACDAGLFRFDGFNFRLMLSAGKFSYGSAALGLTPDRAGNLWLRLLGPTMVVFRSGAFDNPMATLGFNNVSATARSPGGDLLAAAMEHGIFTWRAGRFEMLASADALPRSPIMAIAQTSDGVLWIGARDTGLFRIDSGRTTPLRRGLPDPKVNCLLADGERGLCVGTDNGVARWDGEAFAATILPGIQTLALTRDRDGNLWAGTAQGLRRIKAHRDAVPEDMGPEKDAVTAVFEDREGNLWSGSASGLERLRDSVFLTWSAADGLPSGDGPIYTDPRGLGWFAPAAGGLYRIDNGRVARAAIPVLDHDVVYSIDGDAGDLWLGRRRGGLSRVRGNSVVTFTTADGLAENSVFAVHRARDGAVWAGTLTAGVSRFRDGKFTTFNTRHGLASDTVSDLLEAADGVMWIATPGGLSAFAAGKWQTFHAADGLPSDTVNCVFEDRSGVLWVGTAKGLAYRQSGGFRRAGEGSAVLSEPILGLAQDSSGAIWIATARAVLRANRSALLVRTPGAGDYGPADLREYGPADGLSDVPGLKRRHCMVADALGRIWFSHSRGVSLVDPSRLANTSAPAIAHIQGVSADGEALPARDVIAVSRWRRRITFSFTGLSLSVPERIRFRYKLEEFDRNWSDAVSAREAEYTNLGPGWYRFRVLASTGDGLWDSPESSVALHIQPLLWETWGFRAFAVLASALGGFAAYRLRLRGVAARLNARFEDRLAERTRIAQELHDTMLQGLLGASMQLQLAADGLGDDSPARPSVNRILQVMSQVIEEGRNAIRGIRLQDDHTQDLARAFSAIRQELDRAVPIEFRMTVEGAPRPLHPLVRDDVYRLGRQALASAFRRPGVARVEMQLEYTRKRFRLLVRDDGAGIDSSSEPDEQTRHSLAGMRFQAAKLGGRFAVYSSHAAGTEVEFTIPSRVAFRRQPPSGDHP